MNRFLLLALTAGLLSPIAAKAETWYMLAAGREGANTAATWTVPTNSETECNFVGQKLITDAGWIDRNIFHPRRLHYVCVKGK